MLQTVRQSVRLLVRYPTTTIAAVASLALGIGANTTIFSLIDAVVLRPLPLVWRADRLVSITDSRGYTVSNPTYRDFAARTRSLESLAAFASRSASLNAGGTSTVVSLEVVSGNYFRTLGVAATLGRPLVEDDDRAGRDAVVLSSAFWRQSFAADPAVVGRRIFINGAPFTVAGVAAEGFRGVRLGGKPAGWIAITAWPRIATGQLQTFDIDMRGWGWLQMVGRLRDGTSLEGVQSELNTHAHTEELQYPSAIPRGFRVRVSPLRIAAAGVGTRAELTRFVGLLLGLVLAVLGVACANVSGLLLARALSRKRELAIRVALGASRRRLAGELFMDALLLSSIAGVAGVLVALWTIDLLQSMQLPGAIDVSTIDVRVSGLTLIATAALAFLAALLFGVMPAIHATRADVAPGLKDRPIGESGTRRLLRGALVSAQVVLSLVLLVGAMLFARTLQTTLGAHLGFEPDRVAYATTNVALQRYDADRAAAFYSAVLDRVRTNPAIEAAAWTRLIPGWGTDVETVDVPGYVPPAGADRPTVSTNLVTSGYFRTMGIPIRAGRVFSEADTRGRTPVVVVSEAAASRFWRGDAVGRRLSVLNKEVTVIGVVADVPPEPGAPAPPFVYGNALQLIDGSLGTFALVARTAGDPATVVPTLDDAIRAVAPAVPLLESRTMNEELLDVLGVQRSAAVLLSLLSLVALVLSAGGIYAMVAFWVAERTREFGVRMALGATAGAIRNVALKQAAMVVLAGLIIGLPLALAVGRAAGSLLLELSPADPVSFAGATLLLLAVALAASLLPAERAARTDPLAALRSGTE